MKHLLVFSTVILTIVSSLLLDYSAEKNEKLNNIVIGILLLVFLINMIKFGIWGWIHKNYDVSKSYPITSIFFPLIFIIAYLKEETGFSLCKILGLLLIILGLIIFEFKSKTN